MAAKIQSALLVLGLLVCVAGTASAQQSAKLVPLGLQPVPRLGFHSQFVGYGERVTQVYYGSRAWRLGLEPNDVIVAVNGYRLTYHGAWWDAMRQATYQGRVTLAIRDCRTGWIVHRSFSL